LPEVNYENMSEEEIDARIAQGEREIAENEAKIAANENAWRDGGER